MTETTAPQVDLPDQFRGFFDHASRKYAPLLEAARNELAALPVPDVVREHYNFCVLDRPQPAFMLLPLMHLSLAESLGGITQRHEDYLPWQMLAMELIALYDDTVDATPQRSERPTYFARYGATSAAALSGFLQSTLFAKTARIAPSLLPLLARMFETLCALEVWEYHSRYPEISPASFAAWIRHRYDVVGPVNAYTLDSALMLHGEEPIPFEVHVRFGELAQDVDDIVNIVEAREQRGENDDLKMGIVTYPLLATLTADPSSEELIRAVWSHPSGVGSNDRAHRALLERIVRYGVPPTIDKMIADAESAIEATPHHLKSALAAFNFSFLDRLRHLDPRARYESRMRAAPLGNGSASYAPLA